MTKYFEQREQALLGPRYSQLYTPQCAQAARGVTVNRMRCTPACFAAASGLALHPSPFCPEGFLVEQPGFKPGRHPYHHAGVFYAQEPSASAPAALLDVRPGMRVLDLCAAPGGKSSQLAAALQGQGLLVSNEYVAARAQVLKGNLERMGVTNAVVLNETAEHIAAVFSAFFDRVLVDAPCSGEGMFRKEPQALAQHSAALVAQCAALGVQILDAAAAALAPGGVLVYSTCTFAPEEDESQVGAFLARHPEFELEETGAEFGSPGEANRCGGHFVDVQKMRRIWPSQGGEGHFMAKLRKGGRSGAPARLKSLWPGKPCKEWQQFAGGAFPALAGRPVFLAGDTALLPPAEPMPPAAAKLRVVRAGVLAGRLQKGRFVPEHHLFTAWGAQCANREMLALGEPRTGQYLRGEAISAATAESGWCCVCVDGYPLGGGKVSAGWVKNHYPKGLRLLGNVEIGP